MPRHRQPISRPLGDHMRHDQNKVRPENRFHRVEDPRMTTELQPGVITGMRLGEIFGSRRDLLILSILIDNHGVRHVPHERIQLGIDPPDLLRIEDFAKKAVASRIIIHRVGIGPIHRCSTKTSFRFSSRGASPRVYFPIRADRVPSKLSPCSNNQPVKRSRTVSKGIRLHSHLLLDSHKHV